MQSRFDYVQYDDAANEKQAKFKKLVQELEKEINSDLKCARSWDHAITALEECYMWIGKGLRNDQIERNGSAPLQERRKNS